MARRQPIGIDLGTTNSVAAALVEGRPQILEDSRGHTRVPSVVAFQGWDFTVGEAAKDLVLTHPKQTVYGIKRLMGRRFDSREAMDARRRMAYRIEEASDGGVLVGLGDHNFTPVDISAVILKAVRENAERILGGEVSEAVITIPAHFTHAQRLATLDAAKLAGIKCDRLIHEPTAAALAYAYEKPEAKTFLVFDLGGGTFDVTILRYEGKSYEVLATYGDTYLGGEDFDFRIVDHLARRFADNNDIDPWSDRLAIQRLKKAAEQIKTELSFRNEVDISLPGFVGGKDLRDVLTRTALEELVSDLAFRTIQIAGGTVASAVTAPTARFRSSARGCGRCSIASRVRRSTPIRSWRSARPRTPPSSTIRTSTRRCSSTSFRMRWASRSPRARSSRSSASTSACQASRRSRSSRRRTTRRRSRSLCGRATA